MAHVTPFPPITDARRELLRQQENHLRELAEVQADHVCGICGSLLGMWTWCWGWDREPVLACMMNPAEHRKFRRLMGQTERYRRGLPISPYVEQILEREGRKRMTGTDIAKLDEKGMLARVEMARFPQQLDPAQKKLLAAVAVTYGLDPLLGELSIFQGRPYVSIDGRYRKAQETGQLDGVESRPATKDERADWEIADGDYFFRAEVWRKGTRHPFVGWGRVRKEETAAPKSGAAGFRPLETNPQRMAEKRAEAQALRKAFAIPLPSLEMAGTLEEEPYVVDVDRHTGELIEGVPSEPQHTPQDGQDADPTEIGDAQSSPSAPLAPPKLTCVNDLTKLAHDRYGLQPKQVYAELQIKSSVEVGDLEDAWAKIVASQAR